MKSWIAFQTKFSDSLERFATQVYKPFLVKTLEWRWVTWAIGTSVLVTAVALVISGRVIFQFFPAVEGDRVYATLTMPEGISVELTESGATAIEAAARELKKEIDQDLGNPDGVHRARLW